MNVLQNDSMHKIQPLNGEESILFPKIGI